MSLASKPAPVPRVQLRPSGIALVPEIAWGEHLCIFYDTGADLLETVADFFTAGLAGNEKCLWAVSYPIDSDRVHAALGGIMPDFREHLSRGAIEIVSGPDWYLRNGDMDGQRVMRQWHESCDEALERGFEGLRATGNAFWMQAGLWENFREYENELSDSILGSRMLILCTYALDAARAVDVLDVARAHHFSIARRNGRWEFLESPDLAIAKREIDRLRHAIDILSLPFPGREKLTPRERLTLAQIVRGSSSKEAARALKISPRTVEFHRANIMRKLDARNVAELIKIVLGG